MASDTQIANLALLHMGVSKRISNLETEQTIDAETLRQAFADERDYCLEDFPWPFATAYATLGLVSDPDEAYNDDWFYAYRYPSNCLKVRRVVSGLGREETNPPAFRIGRDTTGKLIFTNEVSPVVVEFTWAITDPQEFSTMFNSMLSWKLASSCGPALSKLENIEARAMQMYELEKLKAQSRALNEGQDPDPPEAEWIRDR